MRFTKKNREFYNYALKRVGQEKILCAAIWYRDLPLKREIAYGPYNINKGVVFSGHRHGHCLSILNSMTGLRQCEAGHEVQGFLTNCNRFVTRIEAGKLAWKAGQLEHRPCRDGVWKEIFSEDLY